MLAAAALAVCIAARCQEAGLPREELISIVEDDQHVRDSIRRLMRSSGYRAEAFASAVDFLAFPRLAATACLIADVHMPVMTGFELYQRLIKMGRPIPTILITAHFDDGVRARALSEGVVCYLRKPFDDNALMSCILEALERGRRGEENP